jgi:hypothetical protein
MTATWTKLREGFGIRVTGGKPAPGDTLSVAKKAGGSSRARVGKIIWEGRDKFTGERVVLCTVAQSGRSGGGQSGTVCCRHCDQMTREGDDWCGACGQADYE